MFDFVYRNRRLVTVSLAFVAIAFSFWGVSSYFSFGGKSEGVVILGGESLTRDYFDNLYQRRQLQMRRDLGKDYHPGTMDNPEVRGVFFLQVLKELAFRRWIFDYNLTVSDVFLAKAILRLPIFWDDKGNFSRKLYDRFLVTHALTVGQFESQFRSDMALSTVLDTVGQVILSHDVQDQIVSNQVEEIKIAHKDITVEDKLRSKIRPTDEQVISFYNDPANKDLFVEPERFRLEYLIWGPDYANVVVSQQEKRKYYDSNYSSLFVYPARYHGFHILIAVPKNSSVADRGRVHDHAKYISSRVGLTPSLSHFKEMAKLFSDDRSSSERGGDIGFLSDADLPSDLSKELKKLKVGHRSSALIETAQGFHILFLADMEPRRVDSFDTVSVRIDNILRKQKAESFVRDNLSSFIDMVESNVDELHTVAQHWKLKLHHTDLITEEELKKNPLFKSDRLISDLLSDDGLRHHRNSEVVPLADHRWVVARVLDYVPKHNRELEDSKSMIVDRLVNEISLDRAEKKSLMLINKLSDKKNSFSSSDVWSAPSSVFVSDSSYSYGLPYDTYIKIIGAKKGDILGPVRFSSGYRIYKVVDRISHHPTEKDREKSYSVASATQSRVEVAMLNGYLLDHYRLRFKYPAFWKNSKDDI
ncbi:MULTISPECIES: peptidylprolyl isomerase [Candidatus Ichthyocystis]|uniref:Periplasmic chaperone PpiD n=1 Tax=Candidatus Ichthyocystis hellenicum TaxID=1561003 RepID=A0A0S4M1I0_9BURK|nr:MULTISPECIES: peptidylprolyl isomerase [Ichthyocystis]CUT17639.1 putative peptidyl-prolyl cis-trans isomerase D [Candidatus Ichthyocystis hellenicum]